jgi:hypothetical protein
MVLLTVFGVLAVTAMLVFYALEGRSPVFVLAFALACLASSAYGFLQGAWPFGVVELIWSGVAVRRCWLRRRPGQPSPAAEPSPTIRYAHGGADEQPDTAEMHPDAPTGR